MIIRLFKPRVHVPNSQLRLEPKVEGLSISLETFVCTASYSALLD